MQAAIQKLGQAIGGQFGDKVINPLLGQPTAAQARQRDNESIQRLMMGQQGRQTADAANNADPAFQNQLAALTGQQPGSMPPPMPLPQMYTERGQGLIDQWQAGQMQNQQKLQYQNFLNPLKGQQDAANLALTEAQTGKAQQGTPMSLAEQMDVDARRNGLKRGTPEYHAFMKGPQNVSPDQIVKQSFIDKYGNPTQWPDPVWSKYNKLKSGVTVNIGDKPATAAERGEIVSLERFNNLGEEIKSLWDPSFTGPIQGGIIGPVMSALGITPPKRTVFLQKTKSLVKKMYIESGKQLSDKEWSRLAATFPQTKLRDDSFQASVDAWIGDVQKDIELKTGALIQSGFIAPTFENETASTGTDSTAESAARDALKKKYGLTDAQIDEQLGVK